MARAGSFANSAQRARRVVAVGLALVALAFTAACGLTSSNQAKPTTGTDDNKPLGPSAAVQPSTMSPPMSADGKIRVALLLPLSGPSRELGSAMLDAAQLALFDLGRKNIALLPVDSGDTPETAAEAARTVLGQGAQIILGPLFSTSTQAVGPVAQGAGVNVISFSNDPSVAGQNVFIMGFTVGPQVARVTTYAISQGMNRFAAIAPNSNYGQAVVSAMEDATSSHGATLAPVSYFDAQASNVNEAVTSFAASAVGVQAVMVPVGGGRLSAVAPLLAYRDLDPRQVKYLGTGLWDEPNIWREGALLGAWYAVPPPEARADFEKRYADTYGKRPPRLATLSYDAVALAGALSGAPGGPDFSAQAITNPNGFAGLDGIFRFTPEGLPERGLAVLEITRNGVKTVSPAPTTFQQITN